MNIHPLSDVVIIRRSKSRLSDVIQIPESLDIREDIGQVVYAGQGRPFVCERCNGRGRIEMQVKEGDEVIFSTHGHQITKVNGEEFVVLRQESIIGIIEDA